MDERTEAKSKAYHCAVMIGPVENKWFWNDDHEKETEQKRKHEMNLEDNSITAEASGTEKTPVFVKQDLL